MRAARTWRGLFLIFLSMAGPPAVAHVRSPDVYVKATAGPYELMVSVHPPAVTPGAAEVDVRADGKGVSAVSVLLGDTEQSPEPLKQFAAEQSFVGSVWVSSPGAWRVRIRVTGDRGEAEVSVPIPASVVVEAGSGNGWTALRWKTVSKLMWVAAIGTIVCAVAIFFRFRATGMAFGLVGLAVVCMVAGLFAQKRASASLIPPAMQVSLLPGGRLSLTLPGPNADLVPDHGHLMHLFAIREPEMDVLLHLHPEQVSPGRFEAQLPSMPPGAFALFADIVHSNGSPETFVASAGLPFQTGHALEGDDALGVVPGLHRADPSTDSIRLADGYRMNFARPGSLHPKSGQVLRFALLDPAGNAPADMQLYMGMAAHAAVVKTDGSVFAHIHPAGNIPMAAYGIDMKGMTMTASPASEAGFPFGFPATGQYRIYVEMKHGTTVETGAFDVSVE